jgi:hypothetical protein
MITSAKIAPHATTIPGRKSRSVLAPDMVQRAQATDPCLWGGYKRTPPRRHGRRAPLTDRQAGLPPRVPRARTAHAGVHLPTAPRLCLRPANKQPLGRARTRAAGVLKDVAAFAAAQ